MKALALITTSLMLLAACTTQQPRFEQMSEAELLAYNSSVPLMDQVYCRKEAETGTYIRKRICNTVREMFNVGFTTLNTPSSSRSIVYGW